MINYAYESLFENHFAVNYVIVDSGATVSINAGIFPTVSNAKFEITNTELKAESVNINESLCSDNNLKFGKMEASRIAFTIRSDADIQENLTEEEIDVYLFFNLDSSTLFKVGRYTIASDKYTSDRRLRNITAYDLLYFLKDYDITKWYNAYVTPAKPTLLSLRNSLFSWLATSEGFNITQETTSLVNDLVQIPNNIESDMVTFEFFMSKVLEINGCFGHINREGVFTYKTINWYDSYSVSVLENSDREPAIQYEPYTVKGIGYIRAYDRDNIKLAEVGSSSFKRPNIYSITDSFVIDAMKANGILSPLIIQGSLQKMLQKATHLRYRPMTVRALGNLCLEVGDKIDVQYGVDRNGDPVTFYTYILDRKFKGINAMRDTYSAKGDQIQPEYVVTDNWHQGDSDLATSGEGNGGISESFDEHDQHFCEIIRNVQLRVLDEPSDVQAVYDDGDMIAKFKWTDPDDLLDQAPITCTWAGTIVVRKEDEKPYNIYDGDIIANITTRDAYKNTYLEDNTIEEDKRYYYGIFPYDTNGYVRFTKVLSVNTTKFVPAPIIYSAIINEEEVTTVKYSIPEATYDYIKLVYKQNHIPTSKDDGTAIDITQASTQQIINGLSGTVYFVIFTNKGQSEPVQLKTGIGPGTFFELDLTTLPYGRDVSRYDPNKSVVVRMDSSGIDPSYEYYVICGALVDLEHPDNPGYTVTDGEIRTNNSITLGWVYGEEVDRIIPADCTLWFVYDAYFESSEGWLDWHIYDALGNGRVYWCFDTKYAFGSQQWYSCKTKVKVVNGIMTEAVYYVNDTAVVTETLNSQMPNVDKESAVQGKYITFVLTNPTRLKNMKIYWEDPE